MSWLRLGDQRCSRRQRASHHLTLSQVGFDWMPWISFERAASVGYHWDEWHINIYGEQFTIHFPLRQEVKDGNGSD